MIIICLTQSAIIIVKRTILTKIVQLILVNCVIIHAKHVMGLQDLIV